VALNAYAHQDLPFERLVEELQPERNLSYSPLFQVMFVLQNAPMQPLRLTGLAPSELEYPGGNAKFDLTLFTEETQQGLTATVEYNIDLFDRATMVRMLEQYRTLLEGIVTDPGRTLSALPLLPDGQRRQLLVDWNATQADYTSSDSLHRLFEAQVERSPDAIALDFGATEVTYRELNRRANQLAHALRRRGVSHEACVGICLSRSIDMIVAVLGTLKANAAYVPLDPDLPKERLAFMIGDARLQILLTSSSLMASLPIDVVPIDVVPIDVVSIDVVSIGAVSADAAHVGTAEPICLDTQQDTLAQESEENPADAGTPDDLVYVTYTSGSTGKPKGIAMTQRPLRNLLHWMLQTTKLPARARTLQFASLSFDVSFQDIFSTLCSGGTLVLITEAMRRDIGGLWSVILDKSVHRIFMPAVALQQLAEGFRPEYHAGAPLRKIISGSEQLMVTQAITTLFTCLKDCRLHNEYGPSETHVVTELTLPQSPLDWAKRPAIGKPIANTQIYLLDAAGEPVPVGVAGELYIGGEGLARGYLNRPEEMELRFVPDPFQPSSRSRLYRTGDLARYLSNGDIEFLGRRDHQLKIRGYRIEAGEIETALEQHPNVREAVVIARDHSPTDRRLVAYLVFAAKPALTVTALRDFLAETLPEYMIPSAYVPMDVLPLNTNGKVDRKALPVPDALRPEQAATYCAPTTDMEHQLVAAWQEALKLQQIGVHDNFFDLGGHSLLIVQVQNRLKVLLAREVAVIDLFRYPTISSLARFLDQSGEKSPSFQGIHDRARKQKEALARRQRPGGGDRGQHGK
jgi:amino acid adenylation domain-containing protein